MSLFRKPELNKLFHKKSRATELAAKESKPGSLAKALSRKESVGLEADIAALAGSMAQAKADKEHNSYDSSHWPSEGHFTNKQPRTLVVDGILPDTKRGARKGTKNMLAGKGAAFGKVTPSRPTSPALSGVGSPSLAPLLQAAEKAKQARSPIIHELAFREQDFETLWQKYPGDSKSDFKVALEKVADLDSNTQNYVLRQKYWRELDVWNHEYASDEERQQAIDNAVHKYDKMRLTASEPEWQKLLPKEERGKGKCLSKVQANIMKGPPPAPVPQPAPKIKVQKADESSAAESGSSKDDSSQKKKANGGGEAMTRSSSQPLPKAKKAPAPEKRWLSNKKTPTPKASPTKPMVKAVAEKPGKFKSKEFVSDSESSDDESAPLSSTVPPQSKLVKKPTAPVKETASLPKPKPKPKPKPEPVVKETIKPQITARPVIKRPLEDDDSSSSSGTPLSKRPKIKELKPVSSRTLNSHRSSDSSQNSRAGNSNISMAKSKNTSPAKSSPLASSPPTNASDMDRPLENGISSKKRKLESDSDTTTKRPRVPQDILRKASKFKKYYEAYENLHNEIMQLETPPKSKVADLWEMRDRLQTMKTEIYREYEA
jgi:RNA polymerase II elongation factor ELL